MSLPNDLREEIIADLDTARELVDASLCDLAVLRGEATAAVFAELRALRRDLLDDNR